MKIDSTDLTDVISRNPGIGVDEEIGRDVTDLRFQSNTGKASTQWAGNRTNTDQRTNQQAISPVVFHDDGYPVARPHSSIGQFRRRAPHHIGELSEGQGPFTTDQSHSPGPILRRRKDDIGEITHSRRPQAYAGPASDTDRPGRRQ